ncbi:MAG: hypothetical protein JRN15_22845, partial [Nitrososphaerota archaeon]|nr:hypothetical protein [Nitrososphaerota archaeon]
RTIRYAKLSMHHYSLDRDVCYFLDYWFVIIGRFTESTRTLRKEFKKLLSLLVQRLLFSERRDELSLVNVEFLPQLNLSDCAMERLSVLAEMIGQVY